MLCNTVSAFLFLIYFEEVSLLSTLIDIQLLSFSVVFTMAKSLESENGSAKYSCIAFLNKLILTHNFLEVLNSTDILCCKMNTA